MSFTYNVCYRPKHNLTLKTKQTKKYKQTNKQTNTQTTKTNKQTRGIYQKAPRVSALYAKTQFISGHRSAL